MRKIKEHSEREISSNKTYWNHMYTSGRRTKEGLIQEDSRANPDHTLESQGMYAVDEATQEVQERVRKLLDLAKQLLTQQQYNVFVLMAVKNPVLTEREAAKVLSLSRGRVHQLWVVAREKLQRAYEDRT